MSSNSLFGNASSSYTTMSLSNSSSAGNYYSIGGGGSISINPSIYTTTSWGNWGNIAISNDGINLTGNSDLVIQGQSMKEFMDAVNERLAILVPNPQLEKEFEELKRLRNEYTQLEHKLREQMNTWELLKKVDDTNDPTV